jgi:DNA-binding MarR family transcriptional regulator
MNDPEFEKDLADLEALTLQLGWLARRRMERELAIYGLTPPQYMALRCVQKNPQGCSMSELADSASQVSATMTGIVDRLVEGGLVQRLPHPRDRRTLRVVLTEQGQKLLEQVSQSKRRWLSQILSELAPDDRRNMIAMGQHYLHVIEQVFTAQ